MSKNMGDAHLFIDILRNHFGDDGGRMHTAAEIGVHRGETSAKLLRQFPHLILWLVDPYRSTPADDPYRESGDSIAKLTRKQQHEHYLAACKATEFAADRRHFCKFPSVEAAKIVSTPRLSTVFLDGAHHYEAVRDDIAAWWPKIEARGLMALHDFNHPRNDSGKFGVRQAVNEFAKASGLEVQTLGSIAFFVKP